MIINFSVKNFRSIKEKITLSFEATKDKHLEEYYVVEPQKGLRILKMAIIYGANASGKTNVLRALDFLIDFITNPLEKKTQEIDLPQFKLSEGQPTDFELEFFHRDTRFLYKLTLTRQAVLNEELYFYSPRRSKVYSRTTDLENQLSKINFGSKIKITKEQISVLEGNTLWNNTVLGGFLKTNLQIPVLQKTLEWFTTRIRDEFINPSAVTLNLLNTVLFKESKYNSTILELIKQADFGIEQIEIKKQKIELNENERKILSTLHELADLDIFNPDKYSQVQEINFVHKTPEGSFILPIGDESEGTQKYFYFLNVLLEALQKNQILLIDELEASLHPDLFKHFLLTFIVNSGQSQLIATTHYRELLMEKEILRHDIIWFTERKADQSTDLYSLADFDTSVIRKENSYYNFYKIGKLGAVPSLGSYYINTDNGTKREN